MKKANQIKYNLPQLFATLSTAGFLVLEWARGTGKSTILGRRIKDLVEQLPRGKAVLVGKTYIQILTRTLPSTISGLEMHGLVKDVHFVVGKKPPESWGWPEAYEPPLNYKNFISFYNGFGIQLLSQDRPGDGRGMNVDAVLADEAAILNEDQLNFDVFATNRGNQKRVAHYPDGSYKFFKDCPLHHSVLLVTSSPLTASGRWIFKYEEKASVSPDKFCFIKANAFTNKENLGSEWFKLMKSTMPEFMYDVEILNKRLTQIDDGFYPSLNEDLHTYSNYNYSQFDISKFSGSLDSRTDGDVNPNEPLICGMDWGKNINCLVTAQRSPGEIKFMKNLYVKFPKTIEDLIREEFASYYKFHKNKLVYFWYDNSGNNHVANSKLTYAEHAKKILEDCGWKVILMTKGGTNPLHGEKFLLWQKLLSPNSLYDKVLFNIDNCKELWISMTNAPAKQGMNEMVKKDKKSERSKSIDQEHATHFSDAVDTIVYGLYSDLLSNRPRQMEVSIR